MTCQHCAEHEETIAELRHACAEAAKCVDELLEARNEISTCDDVPLRVPLAESIAVLRKQRDDAEAKLASAGKVTEPAEPMAKHWRDGDRVQLTNMIGNTFTGTLELRYLFNFDGGGWRVMDKAELGQLRELAGKDRA
jgi:hypothetical protein